MDDKPSEEITGRYFDDANFAGRLLRFFNLLEPGVGMVLSISKIFVWVTVLAAIYVLVTSPTDLLPVLGSISGVLVSSANYAYRRHKQQKK